MGPVKLEKIGECQWLLPKRGNMITEGVVYADQELLDNMLQDGTLDQLAGVASLPGIVGRALAMPDAHQGYGFPIGGVAAFDPDQGVISPGGVGYDINCGVRLLRSRLEAHDLAGPRLEGLADALGARLPAGVGKGGGIKLDDHEINNVMAQGLAWALNHGLAQPSDMEFCEAQGRLDLAQPEMVSDRARQRGLGQLGSLGAGNHFVEVAQVDQVYHQAAAEAFGLARGGVVVWIHSGSRGLGHQVCDDYLRRLSRDPDALHQPDRQLVSARPSSPVGRAYLGAMQAAANYAFANRQVLTHQVRQVFERALSLGPAELGLGLVYDLAHNVAKLERHQDPASGKQRQVWVHRKGATRALGPKHHELPARYRGVGQPVLLPGDMGRASFVLVGTPEAEAQTFASAAHGAGRRLSRKAAKKQAAGRGLAEELARAGVLVRAASRATLAEEMPQAYKDAGQVARVMDASGIARLVARTRPMAVIKG